MWQEQEVKAQLAQLPFQTTEEKAGVNEDGRVFTQSGFGEVALATHCGVSYAAYHAAVTCAGYLCSP